VNIAIHFNDQRCFVTVKINNKTRNNLLSPEADA
jgi:hypothetical protein